MKTKIQIRLDAPIKPTVYSWQEGLGCDHAWQMHRSDMVEQLRFVHDEIGIRSLRFHGIFDDDMWTIADLNTFSAMPGGGNVREVNFRQCGHVYDNLLKCGVKPFVELSFMPSQLARNKKTGLHYQNHIAPPKDWNEWSDYVQGFIRFLLDRYGNGEVEKWWFEVWNEPDLSGFFSGTQKDYFKLYEVTAKAVKSVDDKIRVGGPSTSACKWIEEFRTYCRKNNVPLDFISTHHYPGDAFGNLITPSNYIRIFLTMRNAVKNKSELTKTLGKMFFNPRKAAGIPKNAISTMDDELISKVSDLPVLITEWNSMAIFAAPIHDEKYSAAFVVKSVLDLTNQFAGYFFWCLSDLFEEQIQLNKPFVGGFGILTNDGIPKPNFWAFKMLSKLYPNRLDVGFRTHDDVEYAVFREGDRVQILVYAQSNDPCKNDLHDVELVIDAVAEDVTVEQIDDQHCNPKRIWMEMGEPSNLTSMQVDSIKEKSKLRAESAPFAVTDGHTVLNCALYTNDIFLFTLKIKSTQPKREKNV